MEPVLTSSIPVLFSSEKILSVQFLVLKKWGENRTELNFGNTNGAFSGYEAPEASCAEGSWNWVPFSISSVYEFRCREVMWCGVDHLGVVCALF